MRGDTDSHMKPTVTRGKENKILQIIKHDRHAVVLTFLPLSFSPSSLFQSSRFLLFQCAIQAWREADVQVDKGGGQGRMQGKREVEKKR